MQRSSEILSDLWPSHPSGGQAYPECQYREYPPAHKLAPELCITLDRKARTVAVGPQLGAEVAVAACGGVAAVLAAAGVDLRRALGQPVVLPLPPMPAPAAALQPAMAAATAGGGGEGAAQAAAAETGTGAQLGVEAQGCRAAAAAGAPAAAQPSEPVAAAVGAAAPADGKREAATFDDPAGEEQPPCDEVQAEQPAPPPQHPQQPDPPAQQLQADTTPALQPVLFPLPEYERLLAQLQQFGRQSGVCLVSQPGMIPQPTLKFARWAGGGGP